jgi:HPt (histidine-containing phosphotransfer) domain-containing protein
LTKPIDVDSLMRDLAGRLGGKAVPGTAKVAATGPRPSAPANLPSDADVMEELAIVSRLAGHAKLARVAARFVDQLPDRLALMDQALARADMTELAVLAHGLKGAGGSMGFDDLFEPAKALEDAAKAHDAAAAARSLRELHQLKRRIQRGTVLSGIEREEAPA